MAASTPAPPVEKSPDPDAAEEICKLLEQTVLKYFPPEANKFDRGKSPSVPLVPLPIEERRIPDQTPSETWRSS